MLLKNENIESSIIKNKDLWLYEIKLPWIKRYFESIYYSFEWSNKVYWGLVNKFKNLDLCNKLVWITKFNNNYIICFIDLKNLESKYIFTKSFDIIDYDLEGSNYFTFIYKDFKNKIRYFTNYRWKDYSFDIIKNKFIVKNAIFDTEVFSNLFLLDNELIDNKIKVLEIQNKQYLDIVDFFIFDDYFIKSSNKNFDDFCDFLKYINNRDIEINSNLYIKIHIIKYEDLYHPKIKINLSVIYNNLDYLNLDELRKLLLSFFTENISCYIINNKILEKYFWNYINDFTNLEFDNLDLNFSLPEDIYSSDILFENFKLDLLKLRYNLFLLKESYKLKDKKLVGNNEYIKTVNSRLSLNKWSLEKSIVNYEKKLWKLLDKIIKK